MCPDRQIISVYHDGELPSPWKEKFEFHLESCPECRMELSGYRNLSENLGKAAAENIAAASERVWGKLSFSENFPARGYSAVSYTPRKKVWSRTVTLPVPAAAAAAVLALAVFFALFTIMGARQSVSPDAAVAANIGLDDETVLPVKDMNEVLKYVSGKESDDFMVISLPESTMFYRSGEPALINAADYSMSGSTR